MINKQQFDLLVLIEIEFDLHLFQQLNTVEKDFFKEFVYTLIKLGQDDHMANIHELLPIESRTAFKYSCEMYKTKLKQLQEEKGS